MQEEAQRYPDWEPTLGGTRDSEEKLARKTRELELAELVVCPSNFVLDSLPEKVRAAKPVSLRRLVHRSLEPNESDRSESRPLRVLFAGALTQRKGLADLFAAMKLVDSERGRTRRDGLTPASARRGIANNSPTSSTSRPVRMQRCFGLMRTCDVLVLPSIVEGRALVQQEAMACGLPLIVTRNAGARRLDPGRGNRISRADSRLPRQLPKKLAGASRTVRASLAWGLQPRGGRANLPGTITAKRSSLRSEP